MTSDQKFSVVVTIKQEKAQPFGAHFTTRLAGVNNKLHCALSAVPPGGGGHTTTCTDDPT